MTDFLSLQNDETGYPFPRHGWVQSKKGFQHLRFPILRLFKYEDPWRKRYQELQLSGTWLQSRSPQATLRMLAVALRDLSSEMRTILQVQEEEWLDKPSTPERDDRLTRQHEATERSEVLLTSIFVLLRRLPDQLIDSTRPLLFEDWRSAPGQMKTAIAFANSNSILKLKARCNIEPLHRALQSNAQWFEALRQEEGVRDILVHKDHIFRVSSAGTKLDSSVNWSWRVTADLTRFRKDEVWNVDVIPVLRSCLAGLCDFMESIFCCFRPEGTYETSDALLLTGRDDDATAFWPPIVRECI